MYLMKYLHITFWEQKHRSLGRSGVLSAVDEKMFYPDQASSFLEFAVTFKGLQSPNTLEANALQAISYPLFSEGEL